MGIESKSVTSGDRPLGSDGRSVPDLPPVERSLLICLLRARERVTAPIRDMLSEIGITEQQWRVLRVLHERGPLDATGLADKAALHLASQTRIVQTLIDKGYVTRDIDPTDRRRQMLTITSAGAGIILDNQSVAARIAHNIEVRFGSEKLNQLLDLLDELNQA